MIISLSETGHCRLLPSQEEMSKFDRETISAGTPAIDLMEKAGLAIFLELKERFSFELYSNGKVLVLAGPGNNGGDGLVIAQQLKSHGYDVVVVLASNGNYSRDLQIQLKKFVADEGVVVQFPTALGEIDGEKIESITSAAFKDLIRHSGLIVDALLGTGQRATPRASIGEILSELGAGLVGLASRPKLLAVDMPTGINGDTGAIFEGALRVDLTITVEVVKRGMMQYPAREYCGEIWAVPIGLSCDGAVFSINNASVYSHLTRREASSHKGNYGSVLIVGGSEDMPGAPVLAARGALRSGAGIVVTTNLRGISPPGLLPEIMLLHTRSAARCYTNTDLVIIEENIDRFNCIVLGPGLGTEPETRHFVRGMIELATRTSKPLVLDADALNCLAQLRVSGEVVKCPQSVITPHPGEMARLLGVSTSEVQADRYSAALKLSVLIGGIVVLKGAMTIVCDQTKGVVNTSGNPWLAIPGSGDVLSGMIGSFVSRGISLFDAAASAVALHGSVGDLLEKRGRVPCLASELAEAIPELLRNAQQ